MFRYEILKYEIIEKQFRIDNEVISDKTVRIESDKGSKELAYFEKLDAEKLLKKHKIIDLSNCFFDGFPSLSGKVKLLKIRNSIIISKEINFSFSEIDEVDFSGSVLDAEKVSFEHSLFRAKALFQDVFFKVPEFSLKDSVFESGMVLKNSVFTEGNKNFEEIIVKKGEVNFNNVDFGDGTVSFQESSLGSGRKSFVVCNFGNGFTDFTRTKFGGNIVIFERSDFGNGNISFRGADFGTGTVDFRRTEFGDGEKNFGHCVFGDGNVKFVNSVFGDGKVNFRLADFGYGNVDFHFTHFGKADIIFDRTRFGNGDFDFRGVDIVSGRLNFNHIEFGNGDFNFESFEQINGSISFRNSVFGKGFKNFENAKCQNIRFVIENADFGYGSTSFKNAVFKEIKLYNTQLNSYFDLRVKQAEIIDLSNAVIKDILDLNPVDERLNVENLYLQGVRLLGRIYLDWYKSNVRELIEKQQTTYWEKSEQFRLLKENYRNMGLYEAEDKAYLEFKRMEAKANLTLIHKLPWHRRLRKRVSHTLEVLIFDKMGQYATNPVRVLVSMGIIYLFFSFLFLALELIFPSNAQILSSLYEPDSPMVMGKVSKAFYHSAITFLTIGYGDYYPVGIIRILSAVEGFVGLFMMSYFTVAFVRKILR